MKKIITMIVVLIIIAGLGIGGFWLYKKMNTPLSSELEKIEINPEERKELVENLESTDDKINMVVQLIEDINYNRIFYNEENSGIFHVKDMYTIEYIVDGVAVGGYDYMNRHYVAGGRNAGIMWVTGSNMVYVWSEYKKVCTYTDSDSTVVELAFEDELLCGKYDMGYKATAGDETYYKQFSEKIKNHKDEMEFSEKNGVYYLNCKKKYADGQISSFDDFIVETDGVTYIHIRSDYAGKADNGKEYYRYDHYIEINNKELYEKIIAPIKNVKDYPEFKVDNQGVFDVLHNLQSKYNHEQLMADYIKSIEPKDQTWTVDKVEDLSTRSYVFKGEELSLICSASGKLVSSQMPNEINLNYSFMIGLDKTVMTTTESAGVTTVKIVADEDDIVKADIDGQIDDLSLDVTLVIQSDMSYTCQYNCYIKYSSNTLSFEQTNVVKESGKIVDNYIETETMVSSIKGEINNLMIADSNNNKCKCETTKYEFMGKEPIITILGLIV